TAARREQVVGGASLLFSQLAGDLGDAVVAPTGVLELVARKAGQLKGGELAPPQTAGERAYWSEGDLLPVGSAHTTVSSRRAFDRSWCRVPVPSTMPSTRNAPIE